MLERRAATINIMNHETRPEYLCVSSRPNSEIENLIHDKIHLR